jgi:ABC-type transport system involved in cytochrome c biogenesis permease subunit
MPVSAKAVINVEATMISLGVVCVVAGVGTIAGSLWTRRKRPVFEMIGGGLFLAGLGLAGSAFILVA